MAGSAERGGDRWLALAGAGAAVVVAIFLAWLILLPHAGTSVNAAQAAYAAQALPAAQPEPVQPAPARQAARTAESVSAAVDRTWIARVGARTGIPERALQAYASAALVLQEQNPACRLGWTTLAAIGSIESGHASHGGARLSAAGTAEPPIMGPLLDGRDFAGIPDTDGGALDGDASWDRAVGPMQFIPETWARYGVDANGDGVADPQNIDDAALTAGRYLCASGGDLSTGPGWSAAVYSYNHSHEYVRSVLSQANSYAGLSAAAES